MILIYGIREELVPRRAALSDAIHRSLAAELGLPEDKRAHRFVPMDAEDFYFPGGRTRAYTVIEIHLIEGRSRTAIRRLIKRLFREVESEVGISPIDLEITVHQQPAYCWGFRGMTGDEADLDYEIEI